MASIKPFEKITAWHLAHTFAMSVYRATAAFPREEAYGVTAQLRRAALSIAANIVEGRARKSSKEFLRFLFIARGSLEETEYFLIVARDLALLPQKIYDDLSQQSAEVSATLNGLIRAIETRCAQ